MVEPGDYLIRAAREERERRFAEAQERRAEVLADARRQRDRVYEANKHMSTLCATALGLVFALSRLGIEEVNTIFGMFVFGVPLILSLYGMRVAVVVPEKLEEDQRDQATTSAGMYFIGATGLFVIGVLAILILPSVSGTLGG